MSLPRRLTLALVAALGLAGCSHEARVGTATLVLVEQASYLNFENLAAAVVVYALYDPAAPNWEVQVADLDDSQSLVRIDMRHRALHTGGQGEAPEVFRRAAERMMRERGFSSYEVLAYREGVESTRPLARRTAGGEVRLQRSRSFPGL